MRYKPADVRLPIKEINKFNFSDPSLIKKVYRERMPYHTSLFNPKTTKIINVPQEGSFNPGMVKWKDKYIFVYRPDEYSFMGCLLDSKLNIIEGSYHPFNLNNCADPRLIWHHGRVLMTFSSVDDELKNECIKGCYIWRKDSFYDDDVFRISKPSKQREKNWCSFNYNEQIYFVGSTRPLKIYDINGELLHQHEWQSPWFNDEFMRGNTPLIKINDGYLGTFHTVERSGRMCLYDNGIFIIKHKPPFRLYKCANRTYSPAEDAIHPHFRKKNQIMLNFPCGLVLEENNKVLISYGTNDSICQVSEVNLDQLLATVKPIV